MTDQEIHKVLYALDNEKAEAIRKIEQEYLKKRNSALGKWAVSNARFSIGDIIAANLCYGINQLEIIKIDEIDFAVYGSKINVVYRGVKLLPDLTECLSVSMGTPIRGSIYDDRKDKVSKLDKPMYGRYEVETESGTIFTMSYRRALELLKTCCGSHEDCVIYGITGADEKVELRRNLHLEHYFKRT